MRDSGTNTPKSLKGTLRCLAYCLCALGAISCLGSFAQGQSPDGPTVPPKSTTAPTIQEVKPQVFYLKDKDGKLQLVPDMTLEEFTRLYDLSRGLKQEPPAYSLRAMKITGQARTGKAELQVEISLTTTAKSNAWARVPLRFTSSVLVEPPKYEGPGEFFFDYEAEGDGYVCWLRAAEQSGHKLQCKFISKIEELGAESKLSIITPTSGSLTIDVPQSKIKARAIRRMEESALEVQPNGSGSRIDMLAPAGESQIAWRTSAEATPSIRQTIVANGTMVVRLEGKRRITSEARLRLSTFGAPTETFTVRLPPGMRMVPLEQPGMQFSILEPEIDPVSKKQVQLVEVRLAAKTNGPVEIPLVAEHARDNTTGDQPVEIGGFEVIDAIKQWGTIDLLVEGDQSAIWLEGANVRRIDDMQTAEVRGLKPLARFDYDAQPFSLQVQVVPRKTRVTVEPLYVVYAEAQQLRLDATLKYKVRGAKTFNLEYDFDGWTIDRVGPESLVQSESILTDRVAPLAIPLIATAVPANGEFEVRVQAHRDLPLDAKEARFDVPRPVGGNLTPGSLVVVPADNVDVTTRLADLQGLVADPLPTTIKLPVRQQTPQFYRELGGGSDARFSAGIEVRKRIVTVASTGDVRLDQGRASIEQRLTYNIAYEPLRNLELDVPASLWEAGQMQILLEGTALPVALLPKDSDTPSDSTRARVRVDLIADRIGRVDLQVRYAIPILPLTSEPIDVALPLVLPIINGAAVKSSITLRMTHAERIEVSSKDESWTASQPFQSSEAREPETSWSHATGATELPLLLALQRPENGGLTLIEQMWLQTWLNGNRRQDRAVFRATTAADRLRVKMPPGVRDDNLLAAIDGRRVSRRVLDAEGILTLELPAATQTTPRVIELWYEVPDSASPLGLVALEPPEIQNAGSARRAYWQIILPASLHLIQGPGNLAADMQWQWRGTHFSRTGRLSQSDLQAWSGGSVQADLPSSVNACLFSSFGSLPAITIQVTSRRNVLLACSGLALVIGLALLYLPVARHPAALLLAGIAVASAALWNPDVAILSGQAAVAGLGCVLLARLLVSLYGRRTAAPVNGRTASPSGIEAKSTEPHMRYDPGSQATTATMPVAVLTSAEVEE